MGLEEIEDEAMLAVERYGTEAAAHQAGAELVMRGIGAAVEEARPDELDPERPLDRYCVLVLEHEVRRAQEVLGIVEPALVLPADPSEPMKPVKGKTDWKIFFAIWVAAMIIVPAAAFFGTYFLMSR